MRSTSPSGTRIVFSTLLVKPLTCSKVALSLRGCRLGGNTVICEVCTTLQALVVLDQQLDDKVKDDEKNEEL